MDKGEIIIYQASDGTTNLEVRLEEETVWLTQRQIAYLFGTEIPAISKHIKNIVNSGELDGKATVSKMEIVQIEGSRHIVREVAHYNLDMILSVGYRVNSKNATQFRIWANRVLKDYLIKGYAVNQRVKLEQLVVLSNMESINALLIQQGLPQRRRLIELNQVAITQMRSLAGSKELKQVELLKIGDNLEQSFNKNMYLYKNARFFGDMGANLHSYKNLCYLCTQ
jgi:hypothetical protein